VLSAGVTWSNGPEFFGILDAIRTRDSNKANVRYGLAVNLDNGKLYRGKNGEWLRGEPGSNLGLDLKLGRTYREALMVSADDIQPCLEQNAIAPNFGSTRMTYSLPAGYRPWQNGVQN
jgi:hypothetical protein